MTKFIIQLIDRNSGSIRDARTYNSEASFRAATHYEWPEDCMMRCFDVTDPMRPVRVWM